MHLGHYLKKLERHIVVQEPQLRVIEFTTKYGSVQPLTIDADFEGALIFSQFWDDLQRRTYQNR
eukprot:6160885-Karenia_brevis.AAC.1